TGRGRARPDAAPGRYLGRASIHRHRLPRRLLHQLSPVPAGLPGQRAGTVPGHREPGRFAASGRCGMSAPAANPPAASPPAVSPAAVSPAAVSLPAVSLPAGSGGLVVCSPLRLEARAVRRGIGSHGDVLRTGYGARRSVAAADRLRGAAFGMLAISGTGGGVSAAPKPGDLVVGAEVGGPGIPAAALSCPSAPLLAGELRRAGLSARAGNIVTVDHLVRGGERAALAAGGALVADM